MIIIHSIFVGFMIIRMYFNKISRDFNVVLQYQGPKNFALVASVGMVSSMSFNQKLFDLKFILFMSVAWVSNRFM